MQWFSAVIVGAGRLERDRTAKFVHTDPTAEILPLVDETECRFR
jgi:hypothetical protein